ncbi:hypothetical protein M422DRAFT_181190 [Sphaerobolus stellatus SS14]|uniref:Unplaced genomic scaffold SPHSTscaffold_117, whole genome shotgun sequence n=1 Tax=Sphaerobolus stellatus (strain SS14) TaxID=990650 RepID=A0A0C9TXB8_SPHS4|nr:hypothetical protein M422DRAFT_181190 [Sphaerobolus stellatus SS14]
MSLINLPLELIHKIIENIAKPSDLFPLALTCKSLSNLIIPDYIDYRLIQCSPADTPVWQHLIEHPHLSRNVKTIRIIPGVQKQIDINSN